MKAYDHKVEFHPKHIYPDINFSLIKPQLSLLTDDHTDYGSLFLLKHKDLAVSVNDIGKVIVFYDHYDHKKITDALTDIENAFKKQIDYFEILH